jgi:hypothetical protein
MELPLIHFGYAGGEGDEGANDGKHSAEEDGDGAEAVEEVVDAVEVAAAEEDVAAVTLDHGAASAGSRPVGRDRAEVRSERGCGCEEDEIPLRVSECPSGERHDDFGRDGDTGRLDGHEEDDGGVSAGGDGCDEEGYDFL